MKPNDEWQYTTEDDTKTYIDIIRKWNYTDVVISTSRITNGDRFMIFLGEYICWSI